MADTTGVNTNYGRLYEPPPERTAIPIIRPSGAAHQDQDERASFEDTVEDVSIGWAPSSSDAGYGAETHYTTGPPPGAGQARDAGSDDAEGDGFAAVGDSAVAGEDAPLTEPARSTPVPRSVLSRSGTSAIGAGSRTSASGPKKPVRFSGGGVFRKIMHSEPLPTHATPLVDRLAHSPFASRFFRAQHQAAANARTTLDFALRVGETMFRFGGGSLEVETSVIVITQAYGVREIEIDLTNQSISLNYAPPGETPYTVQRVVRSWSQNYAGLALVHQLVSDVAAGEIDRDEAVQRLAEIRRRPKPFPKWLAAIGGITFAAAFAMFIGGSPLGALFSMVATLGVIGVLDLMGRVRAPEFFALMGGGFIATAVALSLYALEVPVNPAVVVAGGLMVMLPSGRFVSAVQDSINGFPVTAAGRFVSAGLAFVGMVAGIVIAVTVADLLGAPRLDLTQVPSVVYPVWLVAGLVFVAAMAVAVYEQSAWRMVVPTGLVSLSGYLGYLAAEAVGAGPRMLPAVAAVAIGVVGRFLALRLGSPQLVAAVPSILFLLPGLTIFRSMYEIAMDPATVLDGVAGMVNAAMIIMAVAAGVVLGDTLARPLTHSLRANEGRRVRRR